MKFIFIPVKMNFMNFNNFACNLYKYYYKMRIALLVYRLLEKDLNEQYTCEQILDTLRSMQMTLLSKNSGYTPSYKRTDLTDLLHEKYQR